MQNFLELWLIKLYSVSWQQFYQDCTQWEVPHSSTSACIKTHNILLQLFNQAIKILLSITLFRVPTSLYVYYPQPPETQKLIVYFTELR